MADGPLAGWVALVTGVSRRVGIGAALVRRLLADGAAVFATGWTADDAALEVGRDIDSLVAELRAPGATLVHELIDLGDASAPGRLVAGVVEQMGAVDILVANHARSANQSLEQLTVEELDRCWAVNARASLLLVQAFAERHDDSRPGGRVVLFTSGQHLGPMAGELPYAISKGAVHQMTASLAAPWRAWPAPRPPPKCTTTRAAEIALVDLDWLGHCPLLDPLRASEPFAAAETRTRRRAEPLWTL